MAEISVMRTRPFVCEIAARPGSAANEFVIEDLEEGHSVVRETTLIVLRGDSRLPRAMLFRVHSVFEKRSALVRDS